MRVHHATDVAAPPAAVAAVLADPARMPEWFRGARDMRADAGWPNVGGTLSWSVGGSRWQFRGRVTEAALPVRLVMEVQTPSGTSRVTHTIEARPGGSRLTKTVEVLVTKGALARLFLPLFLPPSVRGEVARLARLAEARTGVAARS